MIHNKFQRREEFESTMENVIFFVKYRDVIFHCISSRFLSEFVVDSIVDKHFNRKMKEN